MRLTCLVDRPAVTEVGRTFGRAKKIDAAQQSSSGKKSLILF
jgi:hypothetical protein